MERPVRMGLGVSEQDVCTTAGLQEFQVNDGGIVGLIKSLFRET